MTDSVTVEQCDREAAEHLTDVGDNICNCDPCLALYAEHFARHRIAERERCIAACEAERLSEPQNESDGAYDRAIDDCVTAIREPKP